MTLSKNPICKTLDRLWRLCIKAGKDRCEVCGGRDVLGCHHIVGRRDYWLRWEPLNGVLVDQKCHEHPANILEWLKTRDPERYNWLMAQKRRLHQGQKINLKAIEERLRKQWYFCSL